MEKLIPSMVAYSMHVYIRAVAVGVYIIISTIYAHARVHGTGQSRMQIAYPTYLHPAPTCASPTQPALQLQAASCCTAYSPALSL